MHILTIITVTLFSLCSKGSANVLDRHDRGGTGRGVLERRNSSGDQLSVTPDNLSPSPVSSPGIAVTYRHGTYTRVERSAVNRVVKRARAVLRVRTRNLALLRHNALSAK